MFHPDFSSFLLTGLTIGMALILGLGIYFDRRDQHIYEHERAQTLFHCLKCGRLYSAPRSAPMANCPDCGFENSRLKF
ncbi:MAG TPA: hydrogenase nickel incorporation protein HypA [Opitutales bacterium]|nr:hydrogenase nickel incorporation protein HypA [Opitutales bacterium]